MPGTDSSSNVDQPSAGRGSTSGGEWQTTIDGLTVVLGKLRRAVAALKVENHQLRAEIAGLHLSASNQRSGDAPGPALGKLAEIALPAGSSAPGAARTVVRHCLSGLTVGPILQDAELLVSELVTNSVEHGELGTEDTVLVTIYVAADALRFEIDNGGTAGAVARTRPVQQPRVGGVGLELVELLAARWGVSRNRSTTVWFELGRA
jgi:anti-sigma regulatory factor (Ser/Thr protein kinase)